MAVAYESISSTTWASRTNTTITAPSGITDGDLLLLFHVIGTGTPPTQTPPAGFTALPGTWPQTITESGYSMAARAWYKIASGESGNYTVTHIAPAGAFGACQGAMVRISGADTSSPFTPSPTVNLQQGLGGSEASTTFTGLTTTVDGTLILLFGWDWADTSNNLTPPTGTTPSFTERMDTTVSYVATGVLATAGATGNKTMANNAGTGSPWGALMVAVAPASESGTAHEQDINDSIEGTDAIAKAVGPHKADTLAGVDAQARAVTHPAADTISGTDAITKRPGPRPADTIGGTDATSKAAKPGIADSIVGTDNRSTAWAALRTIPDAASGTDAVAKAATHPVADTGSVTDAQAKTVHPTVADAITGTDAQAKSVTHLAADTISGTDQLDREWAALLDVDDTGELDDTVNTGGATAHTHDIDDSLAGTDTIAREWDAARTVPDTIQGADTTAKRPGVNRADTAAGTDNLQRAWAALLEQADTGQLADDQTLDSQQGQHHAHTVNDGIACTDNVTRQWDALLALADVQTIIDQLGEPTPALVHLIFHEPSRHLHVTEQHHIHTERASLRHRETP
jgi:hypothetical protein